MAKEHFKKLEDDIIDFFNSRVLNFGFPIDLSFYFQSASKQKQLIKVAKIPDHYSEALGKDILIQVNEEYFDHFDEECRKILFDQEIDKIEFNMEKGTFKIKQSTIKTSFGIVQKYSYKEVQRAIEVESLYEKQKKDKDEDKEL